MNEEERYVQAERAAHWLTNTLDELNRQAAVYQEMIGTLQDTKGNLSQLGDSLQQTESELQELISSFETLKSGEFTDQIESLSRSLSVAHNTLGDALNRIKSFTDRYEATYQSMQESSQAFLEEGKGLRGEIRALTESLSREVEEALSQLKERWSNDLSTLDSVFRNSTSTYEELFRSFEEKLSGMQGLLERFSPHVRETMEKLDRDLRETMQGISERLENDRNELFSHHAEENRSIVESTQETLRSTGQDLTKNLSDTARRIYEEWNMLLTERTEAVRSNFSLLQQEIEKVQLVLREENEKSLLEGNELRKEMARAAEQIEISYQTITQGLDEVRSSLAEMTDESLNNFRVKLGDTLQEVERDWLAKIASIRDEELEKLSETKEEIISAVENNRKIATSNSLLLFAAVCLSAGALIVAFWR